MFPIDLPVARIASWHSHVFHRLIYDHRWSSSVEYFLGLTKALTQPLFIAFNMLLNLMLFFCGGVGKALKLTAAPKGQVECVLAELVALEAWPAFFVAVFQKGPYRAQGRGLEMPTNVSPLDIPAGTGLRLHWKAGCSAIAEEMLWCHSWALDNELLTLHETGRLWEVTLARCVCEGLLELSDAYGGPLPLLEGLLGAEPEHLFLLRSVAEYPYGRLARLFSEVLSVYQERNPSDYVAITRLRPLRDCPSRHDLPQFQSLG